MTKPGFDFCKAFAALALALATPAQADAPPDAFRSEFVGALSICTAAYNALANNSERGAVDDEMRAFTRGEASVAREALTLWSRLSSSDVASLLFDASLQLRGQGMDTRDELVDFAIHCEKKLNEYAETARNRDYTP